VLNIVNESIKTAYDPMSFIMFLLQCCNEIKPRQYAGVTGMLTGLQKKFFLNNFSRRLSGYNPGYNRNPSALHPDIQATSRLWFCFNVLHVFP